MGLYEREARERGIAVTTFVQELHDVDRAVVDGEVSGFVKVLVRQVGTRLWRDDRRQACGRDALELTLAIARGVGLARSLR